jgi:hypothetical protein
MQRKPLYFSPVPLRLVSRGYRRIVATALLGVFLAGAGVGVAPGLRAELPASQRLAVAVPAISGRNSLAISARSSDAPRPTLPAPTQQPAPTVTARPTLDPSAPAVLVEATQLRVYGTGIGLVLRAGPSTAATRIGLLVDGAPLTAIGAPQPNEDHVWWPVRTRDGDKGWVAGTYLLVEQ